MRTTSGYEETLAQQKTPSDRVQHQALRRYLLLFGTTVVCSLALVAYGNFQLNPLVYSPAAKARVAKAFVAGSHYAVFDSNIDLHGLRREHITRMQETPQIILFGGSRFQEAVPQLFPGKSFYNANIHSDYMEDVMAITELLLRTQRLPETLILSVRYETFMPISKRTSTLWRNFAPEYRAMAARLSLPSHSWLDTLQVREWLDLLSLPALGRSAQQWLHATVKPGPMQQDRLETLDVLAADGSLRWSRQHQLLFTPDFARQDALRQLAQKKSKTLTIDPQLVEAMARLLDFLQVKGVQVVLAQTPFHPAFYRGIADTAYGEGLRRIEAEAFRLAQAHGAIAVGSFDPDRLGCLETMFIDWHHAVPECLQKVFEAIPTLKPQEAPHLGATSRAG